MHSNFGSWCPLLNLPYGGIIMMFLGVILIGLVVYLLLRGKGQNDFTFQQRDFENPLDVLKRRFAEGSISEEEFVRMKNELNK
jgi:uncharacterized membrane protein